MQGALGLYPVPFVSIFERIVTDNKYRRVIKLLMDHLAYENPFASLGHTFSILHIYHYLLKAVKRTI